MSEEIIKEKSEAEIKQDEQKTRFTAFMKEYGELVDKHKTDFASYPVFVPDGQGGFKIVIQSTPVDITKHPQKSPFMAK